MIAVIDYGMGNLKSVEKALRRSDRDVEIISDPERLSLSDKMVLPGVGAFKDTIDGLRRSRLIEPIKEYIASGKPYLGICMGLQVLFEESEEGGRYEGLGILKGSVKKFVPSGGLKVPHMGWNSIDFNKTKASCPLLNGIERGSYFYFVHSYYVAPLDDGVAATVTDYGIKFTSMVWRDNLYAVQFHPEKSQDIGLKMLRNFIES